MVAVALSVVQQRNKMRCWANVKPPAWNTDMKSVRTCTASLYRPVPPAMIGSRTGHQASRTGIVGLALSISAQTGVESARIMFTPS